MDKKLAQPLGGNVMPRFGGPATMMRLPMQEDATGLDACFIGVPFDIGTSNRSGTRFGRLVVPLVCKTSAVASDPAASSGPALLVAWLLSFNRPPWSSSGTVQICVFPDWKSKYASRLPSGVKDHGY